MTEKTEAKTEGKAPKYGEDHIDIKYDEAAAEKQRKKDLELAREAYEDQTKR